MSLPRLPHTEERPVWYSLACLSVDITTATCRDCWAQHNFTLLPTHEGIPNIQAYLYTKESDIGADLSSELTDLHAASIVLPYIYHLAGCTSD